jgi:hypothetical protein
MYAKRIEDPRRICETNTNPKDDGPSISHVRARAGQSQNSLIGIHFMKKYTKLVATLVMFIAALVPASFAQLIVPSDGSDGALNITTNTLIDLSQAVTNSWSANNTANAGKGIYDPTQWAVVFKYSSVTIASNATVTFNNHPSTAPVVWLVSGNVTINGTVNLDGQDEAPIPTLAVPGPGGYRGGVGTVGGGVNNSTGFGPGAVNAFGENGGAFGGGNYGETLGTANGGSSGFQGASPYGNPSLIPLLGGSGGVGSPGYWGGAAGGGAILIACSNLLTVNGVIQANGGNAYSSGYNWNDGGSGGGIRLVADTLAGSGTINCYGGDGSDGGPQWYSGFGRIRIERVTDNSSFQVEPDASLLPLTNGTTPIIWMPSTGPAVVIETIGGLPAPADPRASFGALGPDVTLPLVTNTPVTVLTTNVEAQSVVTVRVTPRSSGGLIDTVATVDQTLSSSPLVIRWIANVPTYSGYQAMIVHVVRP